MDSREMLLWILLEISSTDARDIESDEIEIMGEDEFGREGFFTASITETAGKAIKEIEALKAQLVERDALISELSKDAERFVSIAEYERVVAGGNWLIQVIDAKGGYYNSYFKEPPTGMPDILYPTRLEALRASVDKAIKAEKALALKKERE